MRQSRWDMRDEDREPPESARKLLLRYAMGERDFRTADLRGSYLAGSKLIGANLARAFLRAVNLSGADLEGAILEAAILERADLEHANLVGANLRGTRFEHAKLISVNLRNADLSGADLTGADLSNANLADADLHDARLICVDLTDANLSGANLSGANMSDANLSRSNLCGANFSDANLTGANLSGVEVGGADGPYAARERVAREQFARRMSRRRAELESRSYELSRLEPGDPKLLDLENEVAGLERAMFDDPAFNPAAPDDVGRQRTGRVRTTPKRTELGRANFGGVRLARSLLLNVDLSAFCDAEPPIVHGGPCSVDANTIMMSLHSPSLKEFLQRVGMTEVFVEYMIDCARTVDPLGVFRMMQSTFISYGSPDEPFARKLYEALHRNGVTTFFFAEHAEFGKPLHRLMRDGVRDHDRMILVCSRNSLDRSGVLNEIEEALRREAKQSGEALVIPIDLDGYIFKGWSPADPGTADAVRSRVVADFVGADTDTVKFDAGLLRLIAALKK
jgi:uncharacterized protein YjbI with pentapeptide repeats